MTCAYDRGLLPWSHLVSPVPGCLVSESVSRFLYAGGMVTRDRDGRAWRIGTDAEAAWIASGTAAGRTITAAIPPVFAAYATVAEPESAGQWDTHDRAMVALLSQYSAGQAWWLGYLDTGVDDVVFPDAPMVTVHYGWRYVLVEAGPQQAATWRTERGMHGVLPELIFPADRSWLVSTLWDDAWACLGGPAELVADFLIHSDLQVRQAQLGQEVTPPGHQAF